MFLELYLAILLAASSVKDGVDSKMVHEPEYKESIDPKFTYPAQVPEQKGYLPGVLGFPPRTLRNPLSN